MIQAAEGTAIRHKTQEKANTATAPAPHLPVPLAALNPRQFVPPLSFHASQSLPREKERRRNETRLRSLWNCRHFRPHIWRGGIKGRRGGGLLAQEREPEGKQQTQGRTPLVGKAQARVFSGAQNFGGVRGAKNQGCWRAWADGARAPGQLISSSQDGRCVVTPDLTRKREKCVNSGIERL